MTAQELLNDRFNQERADYQTSFQREWQMTNQRFGPVAGNFRIEDARRRALSSLHQRWAARADSLTRAYNKKIQGMQEVDRIIEDPVQADEVKMRLVEPTEVERVLFPKPAKESDPLKAYDQAYQHGRKIEEELGGFETEGPSSIKVRRGGPLGFIPGFAGRRVEVPGGGVLVVEEVYDEETGKTKKVRRNATPAEIRRWAALKSERERVSEEKSKLLTEIRQSDHTAARLRTAIAQSPRGYGVTPFTQATTPVPTSAPKQKRNEDPLGLGL